LGGQGKICRKDGTRRKAKKLRGKKFGGRKRPKFRTRIKRGLAHAKEKKGAERERGGITLTTATKAPRTGQREKKSIIHGELGSVRTRRSIRKAWGGGETREEEKTIGKFLLKKTY